MEHQNQSPESPRPNRRQFLFTTGSTIAAGLIAHPGRWSLAGSGFVAFVRRW
jgi:hypothetical protein